MKHIFFLLVLTFLLSDLAFSQYYETGQDPARIHWRQINTSDFQIIYPEDFEQQAQKVAFIFEKVYEYAAENLKHSPRKISVILHTHTVKSNGLVAWTPKRIELFTTPNQQIYPQDWLEQLAVHEFSHVLQMDRVQEDIPLIIKILLGEQAAAIVVGAYLPYWLLEGDAVNNETAFSEAGRGRLPSFLMENKALLLEKGEYSLSKLYLGSYKQYIPNHYYLGYWLTGKTKEKYGINTWSQVTDRAAKNPFSFTPVNSALKKQTGMGLSSLYRQTFAGLKKEWEQELESAHPIDYPLLSPHRKVFTSYTMAYRYKNKIFALRNSLDDITRIVSIDSLKNETIVYTPGYLFKESFSGTGNLFIWSENQPDIRWEHSDRSVICVLNEETGQKKRFRTENKVFAPVISPDLKCFAAVEEDVQDHHFLSVFDLETGKRLQKYATPDNQLFFTPCWNESGDRLFFIALDANGKYLASMKMGGNKHERLAPSSFQNIKNPVYHAGKIYFAAGYSGIDNIYAIDLTDKSKYQLSSVKFGAGYPSVSDDGRKIIFSNYSSDGYKLAELDNKLAEWEKTETFPDKKYELAESLSAQVKGKPDLQKPDSVQYKSERYSKLGHLLNFHSWAPAYINTDDYELRPGVSMFSQNKLGTSVVNLGYDYNSSERTGKFVTGIKYTGWLPVIDIDANAGKRASQYYQIVQTVNQQGQVLKQDTVLRRFTWNEQNLSLDVYIPFVLSSGKYSRLLQPEVKYEFTNISHDSTSPEQFFSGNYQTLSYRLYFYNMLHSSEQSLQSRWGQIIDLTYRHSPTGNIDFGNIAAVQAYLYFPGFLKNHGIRLYNGYQKKNMITQNSFSNSVRIPRGFYSVQNTSFYSFAADYRFPVACPDWSIGKWAYIKRIKASLFYDYGNYQSPLFSDDGQYEFSIGRTMSSLGVELLSDMHVLRFFAPLELGFRSTYRPDYRDMQFELLFSIDFSGL